MSEQENINVVQASYAAFNAHDLDKLSQLWAPDFLAEQTGEPTPFNVEQHRMFLQAYLTAFPDAHLDVTFMIAQGNYVVAHWTGTGTHTGPLRADWQLDPGHWQEGGAKGKRDLRAERRQDLALVGVL